MCACAVHRCTLLLSRLRRPLNFIFIRLIRTVFTQFIQVTRYQAKHQQAMLCLPSISLASNAFSTPSFSPQYQIDHIFEAQPSISGCQPSLPRLLCDMDQSIFSSPSQARRAIRHGRLMMLREEDGRLRVDNHLAPVILKLGSVVETTTTLQNNDILAVRSRMPNEFYPETCTGYVDPPSNFDHAISLGNPVIFEDDQTAIVNKPEGLDTIGKKREDLQSMLPFMLHPPTPIQKSPAQQTIYLPRPIHRLDRKTSGCVMVAKSKASMKLYSQMFANSQIQKSYCAIVFGEPRAPCNDDVESVIVDGNAFFSIDYPIDGKGAMTLWRTVVTVTSSSWGKLSLLHVLPKIFIIFYSTNTYVRKIFGIFYLII